MSFSARPINQPVDILIIGGGILGAACAAAFATTQARILVVEAEVIGGGATAAGMGHLVVMDDNPAELAITNWSCQLWRELVKADPKAHEYSPCGTLWLAADDEEMQAAQHKANTMAAQGVHSEILDAPALYAAEPQLAPGLAGGLLVRGDAIVYPPKSSQLLFQQAGVEIRRAKVVALQDHTAIFADGSQIKAEMILVANGIGVTQLCPELPLRAKQGHIAITDRYPGLIRHQLVELSYIKSAHASEGDSVAFNLQPRPSGQLMLGSSRQYERSERALDWAILRKMLARACEFVPGIAQLNLIRCWNGIRCASPDGLPLLGPHPQRPGIWLACGHEGLGVTTALASAQLLLAQFLQQAAKIDHRPYLPQRFFPTET